MHIAEGIVKPSIVVLSWAIILPFLAIAIKKIEPKEIPKLALLCSLFFVVSLIHIPIGPTSAHLTLNGLLGLFLGLQIFLAVFIALIFQALFFHFGGITVLALNTLIMAFPPFILYLLFVRHVGNQKKRNFILGFLMGFLSFLASGIFLVLILYFTDPNFYFVSGIFLASHLPLAIIEGFITAIVTLYIIKIYPEGLACSVKSIK